MAERLILDSHALTYPSHVHSFERSVLSYTHQRNYQPQAPTPLAKRKSSLPATQMAMNPFSLEADNGDEFLLQCGECAGLDEGEEQASQASGALAKLGGRGRGGRGRGRAKGKCKSPQTPPTRALSRAAARAAQIDADDWKKCTGCKKHKPCSCYHQDQNKCKDCFNHHRSLDRTAETQQCKDVLDKLKMDDEKQHDALVKAFVKHRDKMTNVGKTNDFSIKSFMLEYRARSGARKESVGEMMWEGEYYEFAKTAKAGYLSKAEAEANWAKWSADADWPSDSAGPRGYKRLWVATRDVLTNFDEVSKDRVLRKEEKLGKNVSEETMETRMKMLTGATGTEAHEITDFERLRASTRSIFAACNDVGGSAFDGDGVLAPQLETLIEQTQVKKRKFADDNSDKMDSDDDDDDEVDGKEEPGSGTPKRQAWFDSETQTNKAERNFIRQCQQTADALKGVSAEMLSVIAEVRSCSNLSAGFQTEMQVVVRRQAWLQAVIDGEEQLNRQREMLADNCDDSGSTGGGSRDSASMLKVGPCAGHQDLKPISCMKDHAVQFRTCTSAQEIKSTFEAVAPLKKLYGCLMNSCRMATSDVRKAIATARADIEAANKKARKAKTEVAKKGASAARGNLTNMVAMSTTHAIFDMELDGDAHSMPTANQWDETWPLDAPFVVTDVRLALSDEIKAALQDFTGLFANSSLRVTEGRAHAAIPESMCSACQAAFAAMCPESLKDKVGFHASTFGGCQESYPNLAKILQPSTYGLAAGHMAAARMELKQMGCLRWALEGTRAVALINTAALADYMKGLNISASPKLSDVTSWAINAGEGQLKSFLDSFPSAIKSVTVGAKDMLYVPAGFMTYHRVLNGADVVGLRIGTVARADGAMYERLLNDLKQPGLDNLVVEEAAGLLKAVDDRTRADNSNGAQDAPMEPEAVVTAAPAVAPSDSAPEAIATVASAVDASGSTGAASGDLATVVPEATEAGQASTSESAAPSAPTESERPPTAAERKKKSKK